MTIEEIPQPPEPVKPSAVRWWRNGDHPGDAVGHEFEDPITGRMYRQQEGLVVRYFRRPDLPGDQEHGGPGGCYKRWHDHGWIDSGGPGQAVCPGDLVTTQPADGRYQVLKLRPVYRDRTDHFVPPGLHLDGKLSVREVSPPRGLDRSFAKNLLESAAYLLSRAEADNPDLQRRIADWLADFSDPDHWGAARRARLAQVALAHTGDDDWHWWADMSAGREDPGSHWARFDGHHVQVDVELRTFNERETNDWKGRDEIQASGEWRILCNRQQVWDGTVGRDVLRTLEEIRTRVRWLIEGDGQSILDHTDPRPYTEQLTGRRVYYHNTPAVIASTVLGQGCVILKPVGVAAFPRGPMDLDAEPDGTGHDEQDLYDEGEERTVKTHLDSPHIWWHRRRPYGPDEPDGRYRPEPPKGEIEGDGPDDGAVTA